VALRREPARVIVAFEPIFRKLPNVEVERMRPSESVKVLVPMAVSGLLVNWTLGVLPVLITPTLLPMFMKLFWPEMVVPVALSKGPARESDAGAAGSGEDICRKRPLVVVVVPLEFVVGG
jgi:hypothetical protein